MSSRALILGKIRIMQFRIRRSCRTSGTTSCREEWSSVAASAVTSIYRDSIKPCTNQFEQVIDLLTVIIIPGNGIIPVKSFVRF